jgi:3-dehydroquinate dehydratase/shikimate dehydrogenase
MPYLFQTTRLGFRRWQETDYEPFARLNADAKVMEFFPNTLSRSESDAMIERIEAHIEEHDFGFWAVDWLEKLQFIGFIGLSTPRFQASFTPCVEIGWRLSADCWGQGLATEGAQACLEYGFNKLNLQEIVSFTPTVNHRSMRVMQKIGMQYVTNFLHPLLPDNHWLSEHVLYKTQKIL